MSPRMLSTCFYHQDLDLNPESPGGERCPAPSQGSHSPGQLLACHRRPPAGRPAIRGSDAVPAAALLLGGGRRLARLARPDLGGAISRGAVPV